MKVALTGASGFIGSYLIKLLLKKNIEFIIFIENIELRIKK